MHSRSCFDVSDGKFQPFLGHQLQEGNVSDSGPPKEHSATSWMHRSLTWPLRHKTTILWRRCCRSDRGISKRLCKAVIACSWRISGLNSFLKPSIFVNRIGGHHGPPWWKICLWKQHPTGGIISKSSFHYVQIIHPAAVLWRNGRHLKNKPVPVIKLTHANIGSGGRKMGVLHSCIISYNYIVYTCTNQNLKK